MSNEDLETNQKVAFIYSNKLINELDKVSKITGRSQMVNSLILSYGLLTNNNIKIINPFKADEKLLKLFHSSDYIEHIKKCSIEYDEEKFINESEIFGIGYDCALIENLEEFCSIVAGSSVTAAHLINTNSFKYVINWFGGWHHAKRDKANGFCYINDIVLCILKLRQKFNRILYIDLDQHHGDGVQEAFEYTNKVLTFSLHKWMPGFFPGTGSLEECGKGFGKYYTVNVPLQSGINDEMYYDLFSKIFKKILETYKPEVIVTQCGADSLFGDPIDLKNPFNLTVDGYSNCINLILDSKLPTIFLGGGGYNFANSARLWCYLTAVVAKTDLKNDIPENDYFLEYGPDYELKTKPGMLKNKNTYEYVDKICNFIFENLSKINLE